METYLWLSAGILVITAMLGGVPGMMSGLLLDVVIGVVWFIVFLLNSATW